MTSVPDHWTLKEVNPPDSGQRWLFRKNLQPRVAPRDEKYGFLAYLTFHFNGNSEGEELSVEVEEALRRIEDVEIPALEEDDLSVHVAAVVKEGAKDLLFYTRDPEEFLTRAAAVRDRHGRFNVNCDVCPDPNWEQFEDLP